MAKPNIVKVDKLVAEIEELVKTSSMSVLQTCQKFALAWGQYQSEAWSNAEFADFARKLYKARCAPNPNGNLLILNDKGKYDLNANATWKYMVLAGKAEIFKDKEVAKDLRVQSPRTLYEIACFAEDNEKLGKNPNSEVLKLLRSAVSAEYNDANDICITRSFVSAARAPLKRQKSNPSKAKPQPKAKASGAKGGRQSLASLVEKEYLSDNLLMTPSAAVFDFVEQSTAADFAQKDFGKLMKPDGSLHIVAPADRLSAALRLYTLMGKEHPNLLCIAAKEPTGRVFSLADAQLLLTDKNVTIAEAANAEDAGDAVEAAQALVKKESGENLHLFGDEEADGWVTCDGR